MGELIRPRPPSLWHLRGARECGLPSLTWPVVLPQLLAKEPLLPVEQRPLVLPGPGGSPVMVTDTTRVHTAPPRGRARHGARGFCILAAVKSLHFTLLPFLASRNLAPAGQMFLWSYVISGEGYLPSSSWDRSKISQLSTLKHYMVSACRTGQGKPHVRLRSRVWGRVRSFGDAGGPTGEVSLHWAGL